MKRENFWIVYDNCLPYECDAVIGADIPSGYYSDLFGCPYIPELIVQEFGEPNKPISSMPDNATEIECCCSDHAALKASEWADAVYDGMTPDEIRRVHGGARIVVFDDALLR